MTPRQRQRQGKQYRDGGKYAKVNACYRCGKSAGIDYSSFNADITDSLGNDWNDKALCVCESCCIYLGTLSDVQAWADVNHPDYGKHPQGRKISG